MLIQYVIARHRSRQVCHVVKHGIVECVIRGECVKYVIGQDIEEGRRAI